MIDETSVLATCANCGFEKQIQPEQIHIFSEKIQKREVGQGIHSEDTPMKPGFKRKCKKCGYEECDIYSIGAPYGDESDIVFYKCKKCKHIERYAQGSSNG